MHDTPDFDTEYKNLTPEIIHAIPKVVLNYEGNLGELDSEQVAYAEHIIDFSSLDQAIESAEQSPFTLTLLVRCATAAEVKEVVARNHPSVVGIVPADTSEEILATAKAAWLPYVAEGDPAFEVLTPRITHAVALFDDFQIAPTGDILPGPVSSWARDRGVPIVCDPHAELASGAIESMMDHPLPMLRSLGFNATVASMTTDLLVELTEKLELTIEDLYELVMEAMEAAFLPQPLRQQIIDEQIFPVFAQWASSVPNAGPSHSHDEEHAERDLEIDPEDLAGIDPALLMDLGIDPSELFKSADGHDGGHR